MRKTFITAILIALSSAMYAQYMTIIPKHDLTGLTTKVLKSYDREEDGYPRALIFPTFTNDSINVMAMLAPKNYLVFKAEVERLMKLPTSSYKIKINFGKSIPVLYNLEIIDDVIDDTAEGDLYIGYALFGGEKVICLTMILYIGEGYTEKVFVPFTMSEITKVLAVLK